MNSDPKIIVTDTPDPEATAFITENLAAYRRIARRLPRFPTPGDPGLRSRYRRIDRRSLWAYLARGHVHRPVLSARTPARQPPPATTVCWQWPKPRDGGAAARAGRAVHAEFQAPGFYRKQGWEIAAKLDVPPPGATRYLMTKKLG